MGRTLRATLAGSGLISVTVAALLCGGAPATLAASAPFPDVPPWHWAYNAVAADQDVGLFVGYPAAPSALVENAVTQVYDGFAHARAAGAQPWAERFTYNRPPDWPAPLEHSLIAAFSLIQMTVTVHGDTAVAIYTSMVRTSAGRALATPVHVSLRNDGQDWQVDYVGLATVDSAFK